MFTLVETASTTAGAVGATLGLLLLALVAAAPWLARHAQDGLARPVCAGPPSGPSPSPPPPARRELAAAGSGRRVTGVTGAAVTNGVLGPSHR